MQIVIDIPEEKFEALQRYHKRAQKEGLILTSYEGRLIVNGTPLPDNATNGDVIKMLFPNIECKHIRRMSGVNYVSVEKGLNGITDNDGNWMDIKTNFFDDWWNAPYNAESEDKE